MNYSKHMAAVVFAVSMVGAVMPAASSQEKKTSWLADFFRNLALGAGAGVTEVGVNMPLINLKNWCQLHSALSKKEFRAQFAKLARNPRELYRGGVLQAGFMGPVTAVQMGVSEALKTVFPNDDVPSQTMRALLGGVASGVGCTTAELIVVNQGEFKMNARETFSKVVAEGGYSALMRGTVPKVFRDAGFSVGFLSAYPFFEKRLQEATGSDAFALTGAGVGAGVPTAVLTHPFDTVSTRMHGDYTKKEISGMLDAFKVVLKESGLKGLYAGVVPRGTRVTLAIVVMNKTKDFLSDLFPAKDFSRVEMGDE